MTFLRPCSPLTLLQGCDIDEKGLHLPIDVLAYCKHREYEAGKCSVWSSAIPIEVLEINKTLLTLFYVLLKLCVVMF